MFVVAIIRLISALMMIAGFCYDCVLIYPATCLFLTSEIGHWICYFTPEEELIVSWRILDE